MPRPPDRRFSLRRQTCAMAPGRRRKNSRLPVAGRRKLAFRQARGICEWLLNPRSLGILLLCLRLLPQRFQFFHRGVLRRPPSRSQLLLHPLKPALELTIGFLQSGLRIKGKITRNVYQHKEKIANFAFLSLAQVPADLRAACASDTSPVRPGPRRRKFFELLQQLFGFLAKFFEQPLNIRPVESYPSRARTEFVSLEQGRHGSRNSSQDRLGLLVRLPAVSPEPFFLFLCLKRLPITQHLGRGLGFHVSKNMRMAIDKLIGEPVENIVD